MIRVTTWNVNSVRLRLDLVARVASELAPDVLCLQETKVDDAKFPLADVQALGFPHVLMHGMPNYHGVAILSKLPLEGHETLTWCGIDHPRHQITQLPGGIELHNLYIPSGGDVPDRDANEKFAHKLDFLAELAAHWSADGGGRPMIAVGDFNIAPLETDVWSHKQLLDVVSHTPIEVAALERLRASAEWTDAVRRIIPPEEKLYSWWSYRARDWSASDRGRRLDHVWVTPPLAAAVRHAEVHRSVRGWPKPSDHVPVSVDLAL